MVRAENVGKKFDRRWVLRNLTFELQKGQALSILGRNGAGKSTLLRLLAGLMTPSEGVVDIPKPSHEKIGYFSLDGRVYASLTVAEHLDMSAELRGITPNTQEWLARIGLEEASTRFGAQLSTGMRSRLKLALAVHHEPEFLILDEPAAGLDDSGKALIRSICDEQKSRGALVIATNEEFERQFATHELHLS